MYSPSGVGQIIYAGGSQNIWHLASGNVGIGHSPSYKLDVSGTARVTGDVTFGSALTVVNNLYMQGVIARSGNNNLDFYTNSALRLRMTGAGNVGIGITSPSVALDVSGTIEATADVIAYASSDERLKENIKTIENPIEKVKQIRGVEFDWKEGNEDIHHNKGHDTGLIAQDVEKVVPEIVKDREDGYKGVRYEKLVGLLVESVKEQQKQIEELKSEIQELKDGSSK